MKVAPKGEWGKAWQVRMWVEVHPAPAEFPSPADLPAPTELEHLQLKRPPTQGEVEQRRDDVKKLEWDGRSPE